MSNLTNINIYNKDNWANIGSTEYTDLNFAEAHGIVEVYSGNNMSWYRIWSDGWCEQCAQFGANNSGWTEVSVTLLKPFKDTKYPIFALGNWSNTAESSSCKITSKSITGFKVSHANNQYSIEPSKYYTVGYIA